MEARLNREALDVMGILEGIDKTSLDHDYLRHYERAFGVLRDAPIQLLEIGIGRGGSLRTWKRFFSRATIIGVDIRASCIEYVGDRVRVEVGSQADPEFLTKLARTYQPHIIIDDGSHQADHVLMTFNHLFPSVQPGGFYVMEDLYLHYGDHSKLLRPTNGPTPVAYFGAVAQRIAADSVEAGGDATSPHLADIDRVEFLRRAIIVQKRQRLQDTAQRMTDLWELAEITDHDFNWFGLSRLLLAHNMYEKAELAARRAVALSPNNAHFLACLGHVQARRADVAGAVETLRRAVQLEPNEPGFKTQLANYEARLATAR